MLPGMVDVHSHSFQRTIRGTVESRKKAGPNFWSWRDAMYRAAGRFDPEELGTIARMAFLEMALTGITTVGEFHYVHRDRDGSAYANPNEIGLQIVQAAKDVGIRIALLRVAYVRAGFNKPPDPGQRRFIEPDAEEFLAKHRRLRSALAGSEGGPGWALLRIAFARCRSSIFARSRGGRAAKAPSSYACRRAAGGKLRLP